jgi:hypothetical protein
MPTTKSNKFTFKSRAIRDEAGNQIGKTKKQPSLEVGLPIPTAEEVSIYLLEPASKEAVLIMDAIARMFVDGAREQLDDVIESFGDDDSKTISASVLDYSKLTLEYIANLPPTQRGATALADEDWEVFFQDYVAVMVAATGKPADKINNHVNLFKKPTKAKANKEVLGVLVDQLDIYIASSSNIEETGLAASRIRDKYQRWIDAPEATMDIDLL